MIYTRYAFWLALLACLCTVAERWRPWRKDQRTVRPQLGQDVFWLVFNGVLAAWVFSGVFTVIYGGLDMFVDRLAPVRLNDLRVVAALPLWAQCFVVLVAADFLEWCTHNLLHRVSWLWRIHRVHHSIETMDWIGNFRFHWGEILLYQTVKYVPLGVLGADWRAILAVAVFATAIGNINHANMNISWGPLRYIFNSPRMHIWHHEKTVRGKAGVNFGIVLSVWDWIFGTAYLPGEADPLQPEAIGFTGMEKVSPSLLARFFYPWRG